MDAQKSDHKFDPSNNSDGGSESNTLLMDMFGSLTPKILRRIHRLMIPSPTRLHQLLSVLGHQAGEFGIHPPSINNCGPDYGIGVSPLETFESWGEESNQ